MHTRAHHLHAIALSTVLILLASGQTVAATNEKPVLIVKDTINRILKTLNDDTLDEQATRRTVAEIASERINYYEMSRRILAVNWVKADTAQQRHFIELFRDLLTNTYWRRLKKYRNEEVVYFTSTIEDDIFATVDTVIQSAVIEIPVTYRLKYADGKWLAYDFLVEGQSLVSSYRNSFAEIIKRHGIESLLKQMEKMVADQA